MGLFSWVTKYQGKHGAVSYASRETRPPCFEQLEPRILLSADAFMPVELPLVPPQYESAIVVDYQPGTDLVASEEWLVASEGQFDGETVEQFDGQTVGQSDCLMDTPSTDVNGCNQSANCEHRTPNNEEQMVTQSHSQTVGLSVAVAELLRQGYEGQDASEDSTIQNSEFIIENSGLDSIQTRGPPAEIVFIDSSLNFEFQLENAVLPGVVVSVFDARQDGIWHITDTLSGYNNLSAVHIISHGAPGQIALGTSVLGSGSLGSYTDSLAAWGNALTSEGDILLYGCSVGQGQVGGEFVRQVAEWTDADVAASDDPTGSSELGGNWVLEVKAGTIGASIPLDSEMLVGFTSLLNDFGDAPNPYPTTLAENGAQHGETGPTLGASRDGETDGTHSLAADADDTTGSDDEDGVTFSTIQVGQLDAIVTVNVQNAPSGAKLDAWIDFNGDGSWGGSGERIFASKAVVEGDNVLTFDVPSDAISGQTYARFRLSTTWNLAPGGLAIDGEVEDYQITITSALGSGLFTHSGPMLGDSDRRQLFLPFNDN